MSHRRSLATAVPLALASIALAACSGSTSGHGSGTAAQTKPAPGTAVSTASSAPKPVLGTDGKVSVSTFTTTATSSGSQATTASTAKVCPALLGDPAALDKATGLSAATLYVAPGDSRPDVQAKSGLVWEGADGAHVVSNTNAPGVCDMHTTPMGDGRWLSATLRFVVSDAAHDNTAMATGGKQLTALASVTSRTHPGTTMKLYALRFAANGGAATTINEAAPVSLTPAVQTAVQTYMQKALDSADA